MNKNYCPFVKDLCRDDCVFKCLYKSTPEGTYNCLIAIKLSGINKYQHDDLSAIYDELKKERT